MDAQEREWLVTSAAADYHPMAKILLLSPHLAKRKVIIINLIKLTIFLEFSVMTNKNLHSVSSVCCSFFLHCLFRIS